MKTEGGGHVRLQVFASSTAKTASDKTDEIIFNMVIIELPGIRSFITHTYAFARKNTAETVDHLFSQSWLQNETKATSGPMAAHNKPLRWQNSDEAQAHLSTTQFHMQVAATSSHRSRRLPVLPYQSLARSSGGELTGSEQSVRQSARLAHHMRGMSPSLTRGG